MADDRVLRSIEMQLRKELHGVLVVEVLPGSPAEKAGLKASVLRSDGNLELGDLITEGMCAPLLISVECRIYISCLILHCLYFLVNGEKMSAVEDLLSAIEARTEGEVVSVKIWRKCDKRLSETVRVKLTSSEKLKRSAAQGKKSMSSVGSVSRGAWQ